MTRARRCFALALILALPAPTLACPWHKSLEIFGFWGPSIWASQDELESLFGPVNTKPHPVVEVAGGPPQVGAWSPPEDWPVIAIHGSVLPTGDVLHYSYPGGGPGSLAVLWNPTSGLFTDVSFDVDVFCSGLSLLADGRLYVTGGNDYDCDFQGRDVTQSFDPFTQQWEDLDPMVTGRWYPSNTALGDGRTMILSGLDRVCKNAPEMEIYTPGLGLELIPEGAIVGPLYPRLHLLSSGLVAHVGPQPQTLTFDPVARQWLFISDQAEPGRWDGTSFLVPGYPDQIVTCGGSGNNPPTSSCERIDFSTPTPTWAPTGSMNFAKSHADVLVLPNGTVLSMGGGTTDLYGNPVLNPEIYDPDTGQWTVLPAHVYGRMYHSTTLLLADGRVLVAGQDFGESAFKGEVYSPAYLFNGPRPTIAAAPGSVGYDEAFEVVTPEAADIANVVLIAPSTVTHSVNTGQRYVELAFTQSSGSLSVTSPPNGNHAPPGYFMLFLVNSAGVPSVAEFVRVGPANVFLDGFESGDTSRWSATTP